MDTRLDFKANVAARHKTLLLLAGGSEVCAGYVRRVGARRRDSGSGDFVSRATLNVFFFFFFFVFYFIFLSVCFCFSI